MKPKLGYLVLHPSLSLSDLTGNAILWAGIPFVLAPSKFMFSLALLQETVSPCRSLRSPEAAVGKDPKHSPCLWFGLNFSWDLRSWNSNHFRHWHFTLDCSLFLYCFIILKVTPSSIAHSRTATGSKDTLPLISLFYNWILHAVNWLVHWVAALLVNCGRLVWSSSTGTTRHCPSRVFFSEKLQSLNHESYPRG